MTLPAAAGNRGKIYYVKKIRDTKIIDPSIVTIVGSPGAKIDGRDFLRLPFTNNAARLLCDGANWHVLSYEVPYYAAQMRATTNQTVPPSTGIVANLNLTSSEDYDVGGITVSGGVQFKIPETGLYEVKVFWHNLFPTGASSAGGWEITFWASILVNGVEKYWFGEGLYWFDNTTTPPPHGPQRSASGSQLLMLNKDDVVTMAITQGSLVSINTNANGDGRGPRMSVTRVR